MKVKLLKIELADVDECEGNPGGTVTLGVNGKVAEVIIHPCGEMDFGGDTLTNEEDDAVTDFLYTNKRIAKAFPTDDFE